MVLQRVLHLCDLFVFVFVLLLVIHGRLVVLCYDMTCYGLAMAMAMRLCQRLAVGHGCHGYGRM